MYEFKQNGLNIQYEVIGKGIPFVFLHGMGGSINQILSIYEPIEGVQLITMNQQGHGDSDVNWDTFDFNSLGDDVISLLDHLQVKKAYFAGISMGAAVSLNVATRFQRRVEKMLLIRNAWTDKPMSREVQVAYYDLGMALKKGYIEEFYETEGWQIIKDTSEYTRNTFTSTFADPSRLKYWKKYLILPKKTPISSLEILKRLTMPVTILANRNDFCHPFIYGEYLQDCIEGSKLIEIPDKDKDNLGNKEGLNQAIRKMF